MGEVFFFGVRGGNKGERERKKHAQPNPNTEIKFGEGKKTPRIFSFLKKERKKCCRKLKPEEI